MPVLLFFFHPGSPTGATKQVQLTLKRCITTKFGIIVSHSGNLLLIKSSHIPDCNSSLSSSLSLAWLHCSEDSARTRSPQDRKFLWVTVYYCNCYAIEDKFQTDFKPHNSIIIKKMVLKKSQLQCLSISDWKLSWLEMVN